MCTINFSTLLDPTFSNTSIVVDVHPCRTLCPMFSGVMQEIQMHYFSYFYLPIIVRLPKQTTSNGVSCYQFYKALE